jgi:hypothetical protein
LEGQLCPVIPLLRKFRSNFHKVGYRIRERQRNLVNHYIIRSYQDYWDVKVPRGKFTTNIPRNEKFWSEHDRNVVFDDEISRRFGYLFE